MTACSNLSHVPPLQQMTLRRYVTVLRKVDLMYWAAEGGLLGSWKQSQKGQGQGHDAVYAKHSDCTFRASLRPVEQSAFALPPALCDHRSAG